MKKIYRILGKKGRITIPYEIRVNIGFEPNDVLSFTESSDGKSVVIRREKVCDKCNKRTTKKEEEMTLYEFLNGLSPEQQHAALVHLSVKWAAMQGGGGNGA